MYIYIYMYKLFPNLATFQFHWNFLIVSSRSYVVVYTLASRNPPCIMLHATQITWRLGRYWAHFMHFMGHFMHAGGVPEGAWVFNIYAAFTFPKNIHFMHCAYTMRQHCCGLKENVIISMWLTTKRLLSFCRREATIFKSCWIKGVQCARDQFGKLFSLTNAFLTIASVLSAIQMPKCQFTFTLCM